MARIPTRGTALAAGAAAIAVGVAVTIWCWPSSRHHTEYHPPTINTIAQNLRACLLTDGSEGSSQIWKGLQGVAESDNVNAQQTTQPAQSSGDPGYINSLIQQHCTLILTVGDSPSQVALATATGHPEITFATPGQAGEAGPANVKHFRLGNTSTTDIRTLIEAAKSSRHS